MKRFACSSALLVLIVAGLFAQADLQPIANVRVTKTEPITLKQLKSRCDIYQRQLGSAFGIDQKKEVLDAMINEKLVVQAAQKAGISVTDTETNQYFLQSISQQIGAQVTEPELASLVKSQTGLSLDDFMRSQVGMSVTEYKAYLKNQLIAQRYIMSLNQAELAKTAASDQEIRAYYEMNRSTFAQNENMKLFLVIVPKGSDAASAKTKTEGLLRQLKGKSVTLNELKVRSQADGSGYQAGDVFIAKTAQAASQLGMDYTSLLTLFTRDSGYISELVETASDYQFHVVQEKYPAKLLELSDLIQPGTTITVYEYIKNVLTQQKQSTLLNNALNTVVQGLRTPENYQILKTGAELDKLLTW